MRWSNTKRAGPDRYGHFSFPSTEPWDKKQLNFPEFFFGFSQNSGFEILRRYLQKGFLDVGNVRFQKNKFDGKNGFSADIFFGKKLEKLSFRSIRLLNTVFTVKCDFNCMNHSKFY